MIDQETQRKAIELYHGGMDAKSVSKLLGIAQGSVFAWLRQEGIRIRGVSEVQGVTENLTLARRKFNKLRWNI